MERRAYLGVVASSGAVLVSGCLVADDESEGGPADEDADVPETGGSDGGGPGEGGVDGPEAIVEAFLDAASDTDEQRLNELLHPLSPLGESGYWRFEPGGFGDISIETSVAVESPTVEGVTDVGGAESVFADRTEQLREVLDGEAAIVSVRAPDSEDAGLDGSLWVTATNDDDEWGVVWMGTPDEPAQGFEVRVVDSVAFDREDDRATVSLRPGRSGMAVTVDSGAETQTVEAGTEAGEVVVGLGPDGGELTVTVAVGGDEQPVHRERYGDERLVEGITTSVRETEENGPVASAKVSFTDRLAGDRVEVVATRSDVSGVSSADQLPTSIEVGGLNPDGDELVVTVGDDGEKTEVHRERFTFDR